MYNWKELLTEQDVDDLIVKSAERPQLIFKHSVSCGISAHALFKLEEGTDTLLKKADANYLNLLRHRNVSNYIARIFSVTHQSPQVIILKNGRPVYSTSHHAISVKSILEKL
ncbi:MAG: bacillithiol system redox-active protein YtxJ [Chitinophagaceae bacterium]